MHLSESQSLPTDWKIFGLIPAAIGILGAILFQRSLRKNIESNRWPEESLEAARAVAERSWWTGAMAFAFFLSVAVFILSTRHYFAWPTIMLASGLSDVRRALRPLPRKSGPPNSIYPVKPLVSEYWGLPPHAE